MVEEAAEGAQVEERDADAPLVRELVATAQREELVAALLAAVRDAVVLPGVPLS